MFLEANKARKSADRHFFLVQRMLWQNHTPEHKWRRQFCSVNSFDSNSRHSSDRSAGISDSSILNNQPFLGAAKHQFCTGGGLWSTPLKEDNLEWDPAVSKGMGLEGGWPRDLDWLRFHRFLRESHKFVLATLDSDL